MGGGGTKTSGGGPMTLGGWIVMALSVGGVSALLAWCVYKVVAAPGSSTNLHSQAEIEPPDAKED